MQTYIEKKLKKYAEVKEEILAMFYVKSRNETEEFTEIYTVVSDVIISKMFEELESLFDDVILTNKRKASFKLDKRWQKYTILEVYKKDSSKVTESVISSELAVEFLKDMPNDIEFLYDKMDLKGQIDQDTHSYDLPKEYEFNQCQRQFFAYALEASFLLVEKNQIASSLKMQELRNELLKMVDWYIRDRFSNTKNVGKKFENINYSLEEEYRSLAIETFSNTDYLEIYNSIFKACQLFRKLGLILSGKLNFPYLKKEDVECLKVLRNNYKKIESLVL